MTDTPTPQKKFAVREVRKKLEDLKPGDSVTIDPETIRPGLEVRQLQIVVLNARPAGCEILTRQKANGLLVIRVS